MFELIIVYDKLIEEKEDIKVEIELVKESYRLIVGEFGKQQVFEKCFDEIGKLFLFVKDKFDVEYVVYLFLVEEVVLIEKQIEEVKKEYVEYCENL